MSVNDYESDSDGDPDWDQELINAIRIQQGELKPITEQDRIDRIQECLGKGANVNTVEKHDKTALHIAVKKGWKQVAEFLVKHGANPYCKKKNGQTVFELAEALGKQDILRDLNELVDQRSHGRSLGDQGLARQTNGELSQVSEEMDYYGARLGAKGYLHGYIYQLKLLMLFVARGIKKNYDFSMATEMDAAEKFDDVVFRYKDNNEGGTICRYLQAKHILKKGSTIKASDLLNEKDGDFSLQKYFSTYRNIKKHPELTWSKLENCTICTNIDFDWKNLESKQISLQELSQSDDFLDTKNSSKRYKLKVNDVSKWKYKFEEVSDVRVLAKELAKHFHNNQEINIETKIFKTYNTALATEVLDIGEKWFYEDFRKTQKNLSEAGKNFRKIFVSEYHKQLKLPMEPNTENYELPVNRLKFSNNFVKATFKQHTNPTLENLTEFSKAFVRLIRNAKGNKLIKVNRKIDSKNVSDECDEKYIGINIDRIAGHVLIRKDNAIKFRSQFFDDRTTLPEHINGFKKLLKEQLKDKFGDLKEYRFVITNSQVYDKLSSSEFELPNDEVKDEEILEFFDKLVFAVNQPNEVSLGDILKEEIGENSQFNLLSVDIVCNSFQATMLDWFKKQGEEDGKEGVFYTSADGKAFLESIEQQIKSLISSGLTSAYREQLEEYGMEFNDENKDLKDFLDNRSKRVLNLISIGETLPTAIRVHKTIQKVVKNEGNRVIFIRSKILLPKKNQEIVIGSFESSPAYKLLVIHCKSSKNEAEQQLHEVFKKLSEVMEKNSDKQLILITQRENESSCVRSRSKFVNCATKFDEVRFNSLAEASRMKLLDKEIITFQGLQKTPISFRTLLGDDSCNTIVSTEVTDFGDAIDPTQLVKLICGQEIKVGDELKKLDEVGYYIDRVFNQVFIKKGIHKCEEKTEVFAISGIKKEALGRLCDMDQKKIQCYGEINSQMRDLYKFIILDSDQESEQFEVLCTYYPSYEYNFHWLKYMSGKFIWIKSRGDIKNMMRYKDQVNESPNDSYLTEHQLADFDVDRKVVIISDKAGMGKSTVFTSLAKKVKDKARGKSVLWVIRIDLNEFTEMPEFDERNNDQVVKFFVENLSGLTTGFEKTVLATMITEKRGGLALLFDGFDEISSNYQKKVIAILLALKNSIGVEKLFISTRPNMCHVLEEQLEVFSQTIKPFTKQEQVRFLINFWGIALNRKGNPRLNMYAEAMIERVTHSAHDPYNTLSAILLPTLMIAENFLDDTGGVEKEFDSRSVFLDSNDEYPKLPIKIIIRYLYDRFVDKKCNIYYRDKLKIYDERPGAKQMIDLHRKTYREMNQKLAVHTLFTAEDVLTEQEIESVKQCINDINKKTERSDIITHTIDDKAQYIHRSFAEYFAADFVFMKLKDNDRTPMIRKFIVEEILIQPQNDIIRVFLNSSLQQDPDVFVDITWIGVLYECHKNRKTTIFHLGVKERNYAIIKFFLRRCGENDKTSELLNEAEDITGATAFYKAALFQRWEALKLMVPYGGASVNWQHRDGYTLLHWAAYHGCLEIVEWLVNKQADVFAKAADSVMETLFSSGFDLAFIHEYPKCVLKLLSDERMIFATPPGSKKWSVLFMAVLSRRTHVVDWLLKNTDVKVEDEDNGGVDLVSRVASDRDWQMLRLLIEESLVDIDAPDIRGSTILKYVLEWADLNDIKWMVQKRGVDVKVIRFGDSFFWRNIAARRTDVFEWLANERGVELKSGDIDERVSALVYDIYP